MEKYENASPPELDAPPLDPLLRSVEGMIRTVWDGDHIEPVAICVLPSNEAHMIHFVGMDVAHQRAMLKRHLAEARPSYVDLVVVNQVVVVPVGEDPIAAARTLRLRSEGRLELDPDAQHEIHIYRETPVDGLSGMRLRIEQQEGRRVLAPALEPITFSIPYPGWRRYWPDLPAAVECG